MHQDGVRFLEKEITQMKVAVIGDMMTDRYITGRVNRISPEAPVPVNLVESQREVPGGAANTAANLAALGFGTTAVPGMAICDPANNGYLNYIIAHLIALGVGLALTIVFGKALAKKNAAAAVQ